MSTSEISKTMAPYLLQGWAMLGETCHCDVPLLESREGKRICIRCDVLKKGEQFLDKAQRNDVPRETPQNEGGEREREKEREKEREREREREREKERERETPSSSDISRLLSIKMQQGYSLLQDCCPSDSCQGVPLVQDKKTKQMHCVSCKRAYLRPEDHNPATHSSSPPASEPAQTKAPSSSPPAVPKFHYDYSEAEQYFKDEAEPSGEAEESLGAGRGGDSTGKERGSLGGPREGGTSLLPSSSWAEGGLGRERERERERELEREDEERSRERRAREKVRRALIGRLEESASLLPSTSDLKAAREHCELISAALGALAQLRSFDS